MTTTSRDEFLVGRHYQNHRGGFVVLTVDFPLMHVRYDDGEVAALSIPIQQRLRAGRAVGTAAAPPLADAPNVPPHTRQALPAVTFWWVNQGSSFAEERRREIVAAPLHGADGRVLRYHEAVQDLRPGHRMLHYVRREILAIGRVVAPTEIGVLRPYALERYGRDRVYLGHVTYTLLGRTVHVDEIPVAWRIAEGGPFNREGNPKFGYLFPLSRGFVQRLLERFPDRLDDLRG